MKKWFHAIGICGKATSNVAKMFKDMGWFVTGSDFQYFPPVSEFLIREKINTAEGYNFKHLTREYWERKLETKLSISDKPDLGLIVESTTAKNKELLFAKVHKLDFRPFSQILGEYLVKQNSVVVIGTAGKTTTTSLVVRVLQELNLDPSYMIGAEVKDLPSSLVNTESDWSVLEGDEYHSKEFSRGAKFLEYKPKYLIITNIGYEHQDVFPTQKDYIDEFKKCVELVPEDGLIIAKWGDENIDKIIEHAKCKVVRYFYNSQIRNSKLQKDSNLLWTIEKDAAEPKKFKILNHKGEVILRSETKLLGEYNLENILATTTLICNLPSKVMPAQVLLQGTGNLNIISKVFRDFLGPKKRLEILHSSDDLVVVDDFGVAPNRTLNSLNTLKQYYPDHKIVAIFEPNSGSRFKSETEFKKNYSGTFDNADQIIIPDLSDYKNELATSEEIVKWLNDLGVNAKHVPNSSIIAELSNAVANHRAKTLIVFFSSYRLTEIANKLVESIV